MRRIFRILFVAIALIGLGSLAIGTALARGGGGGHGGGGGGGHFGGGGGHFGGAHFGGTAHFGSMGLGAAPARSFGGVRYFGGTRFGTARFHRGPFVGFRFRHGRRFFGPAYTYYGPYYHHRCWVHRRVWTPWGWRWRLFNRCRYHPYWRYY